MFPQSHFFVSFSSWLWLFDFDYEPSSELTPGWLIIGSHLERVRLSTFPKLLNVGVLSAPLVRSFFHVGGCCIKFVFPVQAVVHVCLLMIKYWEAIQVVIFEIILTRRSVKHLGLTRGPKSPNQVSRSNINPANRGMFPTTLKHRAVITSPGIIANKGFGRLVANELLLDWTTSVRDWVDIIDLNILEFFGDVNQIRSEVVYKSELSHYWVLHVWLVLLYILDQLIKLQRLLIIFCFCRLKEFRILSKLLIIVADLCQINSGLSFHIVPVFSNKLSNINLLNYLVCLKFLISISLLLIRH